MNIVRLNPFEKARLRPTMYIGSVNTRKRPVWIYDEDQNLIVMKEIRFNSGLFNIVREIISNAIDNVWRSATLTPGTPVRKIEINVDKETGEISIWNDGMCFSIEKQESKYKSHRTGKIVTEEMYPAEICFGEMDAGSNYNDEETRKTSGTNGVGAKLTNIFSTRFQVECSNPEDRKKFVQVFTDGASNREDPKVTSFSNKYGYTKVTFTPDYEYFKYPNAKKPGIDDDFYTVLKRYAHEVAMITKTLVKFNGEAIRINKMEKFARMIYPDTAANKMVSFTAPNGDECVVIETDIESESSKEVQHYSFVNGIRTKNGGIHVDKWSSTLITAFNKAFNASRKSKKLTSRPEFVRPYLMFFIRTEADKPIFENQVKDELVQVYQGKTPGDYSLFEDETKKERDAWNAQRDANIKKMMKWSFVSKLEEALSLRAERVQDRNQGPKKKKVYGDGISDAHAAGGKESDKCTLYITEGLSAKTFADGGVTSLEKGPRYNGTFAIRGKFINPKKCSTAKLNANAEVQKLKELLNLRKTLDYSRDDNFNTLRYKKVVIVADNDDDGIHIRALVMNFFMEFTGLYERGFVESLSTAVIEVHFKGRKARRLFYTVAEYESWLETDEGRKSKPQIKEVVYNKGLGSIEPKDAPMYYRTERKIMQYITSEEDDEYVEIGLGNPQGNPGLMQKRKDWITRSMSDALAELSEFSEEESEDNEYAFVYQGRVPIARFIKDQLVIYFRMDLNRKLPCLWDSFKSSGRKIFFAVRKRALENKTRFKNPQNLEQLAGTVKEETAYHHGETSLYGTMIGMGQRYVGSNNISLFRTRGNFGTRKENGKDSAAARYIAATLDDIAHILFSEKDDPLLDVSISDNQPGEYRFFLPVIPMILVNGAVGCIAAGYKSDTYNYNPDDLVEWIRTWINNPDDVEGLDPLVPWYRGYKGEIEPIEEDGVIKKWVTRGVWEKCRGKKCDVVLTGGAKCRGCEPGKNWFHITEIPVGMSILECREWLEYMESGKPADRVDSKTGKKVAAKKWKQIPPQIRNFKDYSGNNTVNFMIQLEDGKTPDNIDIKKVREKTYHLTNMWLIDENDYPHLFERVEDIMWYFCERRLRYYGLRKKYILNQLKLEIRKASNRYRFVKAVAVDKTLDLYLGDSELREVMENEPFKFRKLPNGKTDKEDYDYLLSLQMRSMTQAKLKELQREFRKLKKEFDELKEKSPGDLWNEDLDSFEEEYQKYLKGIYEE